MKYHDEGRAVQASAMSAMIVHGINAMTNDEADVKRGSGKVLSLKFLNGKAQRLSSMRGSRLEE